MLKAALVFTRPRRFPCCTDGFVDHYRTGFACMSYEPVVSADAYMTAAAAYGAGNVGSELRSGVIDFDGDGDDDVLAVSGAIMEVFLSGAASPSRHNTLSVRVLTRSGVPLAWGASVRVDCVAACGLHEGYSSMYAIGSRVGSRSATLRLGFPDNFATYDILFNWPDTDVPEFHLTGFQPATAGFRVATVPPPPHFYVSSLPYVYDASTGPPAEGHVATLSFRIAIPRVVTSMVSCTIDGVDVTPTFSLSADASNFTLQHTTQPSNLLWPWHGLHIADCVVVSAIGQEAALLS